MSGYASRSKTFKGQVKDGKLEIADRDELLRHLTSLEGRSVDVTITPEDAPEKLAQQIQ